MGEFCRFSFLNMWEVNLNVQHSACLMIREVIVFWQKTRTPTRSEQKCIKILEDLYQEWRSFQKLEHRQSETQVEHKCSVSITAKRFIWYSACGRITLNVYWRRRSMFTCSKSKWPTWHLIKNRIQKKITCLQRIKKFESKFLV